MDEAVYLATRLETKQIDEKRELPGGGFLIIQLPPQSPCTVHAFRTGASGQLYVKAMAPPKYEDLLTQICSSLSATP